MSLTVKIWKKKLLGKGSKITSENMKHYLGSEELSETEVEYFRSYFMGWKQSLESDKFFTKQYYQKQHTSDNNCSDVRNENSHAEKHTNPGFYNNWWNRGI